MHMLDFEHRKIYHSTSFVDLNETSIDYYHKKLEEPGYISFELFKRLVKIP